MDADLASLSAQPSREYLSLVVEAPLVEPEAFLRLPLPGDPLLWDGAAWGQETAAARGVVAGWSAERGLQEIAAQAGSVLRRAEVRSCVEAPGPRCYGGIAFAPAGPSPLWRGFGGGLFVLPRFVYERTPDRARLRLNVAPGEPVAPLLDALQSARLHLAAPQARPAAPPRGRLVDDAALAYRAVVARAVAAIEDGLFEKLVAARALELVIDHADPWVSLARLAGDHLVRFALGREDGLFLGATPERLITFDGAALGTEALAGSIAASRGAGDLLLGSDKDRREHQVVVDAILRALSPLCGELDAPRTPAVRPLRHLLHLVTPIRGRVRQPTHVLDLVAALHPTPAVCGLPRGPAAAWLLQHEGLERGWYAGPIGWFDGQGRGAFAVALRSALLRGPHAHIFVGAGLVRGSTPDGELAETSLKARAMLDAMGVQV